MDIFFFYFLCVSPVREHLACSQWPGKAAELGCHFPSPRDICRFEIVSSYHVVCEKVLERMLLGCILYCGICNHIYMYACSLLVLCIRDIPGAVRELFRSFLHCSLSM